MNTPYAPSAVTAHTTRRPKQLNEKAIQVQLATSRARLSKRDVAAESFVQGALGDESLTAYSKLFRDKTNPINRLMTEVNKVYTHHVTNTWPTPQKGVRLLPMQVYDEYRREMRSLMDNVEALMQKLMPFYDDYVLLDISSRGTRANVSDYPSAYDFQTKLKFDLRLIPLPDVSHFLFDIDEADMRAFEDGLKDIEQMARQETVKSMLVPLQHLVDKLALPIGTDGSVFRNTALENVIEGIEQAKKLCIDDSPEIQAVISALDTEVKRYSLDWLRESPVMREQANKNLSDIASQMSGFM
jgi:hypothetical protein